MSDESEYYAEDLELLRKRVDKCNSDILDSLIFFMQEADTHMAGISENIMKETKDEIKRYKKDCRCEKRYPLGSGIIEK